jgi:hypothetical protein
MIKFNRAQLKNPTPASVSFKINVGIALFSAVGGWIGTAGFIPASLSTILQSILSLLVLICVAIKPFFGVDPVPETVQAEDVKEVEDIPKRD